MFKRWSFIIARMSMLKEKLSFMSEVKIKETLFVGESIKDL